jgi:hypothetical protein
MPIIIRNRREVATMILLKAFSLPKKSHTPSSLVITESNSGKPTLSPSHLLRMPMASMK